MRREYIHAEVKGQILLDNRFDTEKGVYQVTIRKYNSGIYFFKYRNGVLLECQNLSKMKTKEDNNNDRG